MMDLINAFVSKVLPSQVKNIKTKVVGIAFNTNENWSLKDLGNGNGVRHLTIRNTGNVDIILNNPREVLRPGESFAINSMLLVTNESFEVAFKRISDVEKTGEERQEGILRYLVDIEA